MRRKKYASRKGSLYIYTMVMSLEIRIFASRQKTCLHSMEKKISTSKQYAIGFALSGGFIKGFAHLGAMQALDEHGIRPDIISGVSAGAIAGAFIADGREPYEVVDIFMRYKFNDLATWARSTAGLFKLNDFITFLRKNLRAEKIEDLSIPLLIEATDFDHGRQVMFRRGRLAERIAASCCMPIVFSPVRIGNTYYVDGGVLNNMPVAPIRDICDKIIGINVSPVPQGRLQKMNVVNIALRTYTLMFHSNTFEETKRCDLLLEPEDLDRYHNRELEYAGEIFKKGYEHTQKRIDELINETGSIWNLTHQGVINTPS